MVPTPGNEWDPRVLDHILTDKEDWYDTLKDYESGFIQTPFDVRGNYLQREKETALQIIPDISHDENDLNIGNGINPQEANRVSYRACFHDASNVNEIYTRYEQRIEPLRCYETKTLKKPREIKPKKIDYKSLRPYFLHVSADKVRATFKSTTQFATNVMSGHHIQQTIKSPYPALNVWRRNEPVASDTIYGQVPAVDSGGITMAQIFVGRKSLVTDVYSMTTDKEFVNTLEDVIRKRGAMDKLITDSARVEQSKRVLDILRALCIDGWQSEAHYQHQNFAEHRWKHIKRCHQWYMNWRNVNANAWLLLLEWVADVMNHTAEESLGWKPPLQKLTGQTIDISILLYFMFWDVVYVSRHDDTQYHGQIGSEKSSEIRGRFVGFAWSVGHALTFKILTDDTQRVINRSRVRLSKDGENNLKLDAEAGAKPEREFLHSKRDSEASNFIMPTIDLTDDTHQRGWVNNEEYHRAFERRPVDLTGTPGAEKNNVTPKDGETTDSTHGENNVTPKDGETTDSTHGESTDKDAEETESPSKPIHVEDKTSARDLRAARRAREPVRANKVQVETVDDEEEDDDYSPLDDPRLADIIEPDELPAMDKDLPYYWNQATSPTKCPSHRACWISRWIFCVRGDLWTKDYLQKK